MGKNVLKATCCVILAAASLVSAAADVWPRMSMRQMWMHLKPEDERTMLELISIDARHRGCWEEQWLGLGPYLKSESMRQANEKIAAFAAACRKAGIVPGAQQGVTLGHDMSTVPPDAYVVSTDAMQVDVDGRRTEFYCPRSPEVLAMEEWYAERVVRDCQVESLWLDDDLRLGFYKRRAAACFCDRCVEDFNRVAGTGFDRAGLVARLSSSEKQDPLRAVWSKFKAQSLALFAAAARRGAVKANPRIRLGYQAISSASINSGEDYGEILNALAGEDGRTVGIRAGHGYYAELKENSRWKLPQKILDVAREAERCHAYTNLDVFVVYEQENYPHLVMYKSPEACIREAALGLAVGCDGVAYYWYSPSFPEPLEHYEDFARLAAAWRPYLDRLVELNCGTHLGGVALRPGPDLLSSDRNTVGAFMRNEMARRSDDEVQLAQYAVPVTVAEAGTKSFFNGIRISRETTSRDRAKLLDRLDALPGGPLPVRIDKMHPMLVYPRIDRVGRTVAVTLLNLSLGRTQNLVLRVRRPVGSVVRWLKPCAEPCVLPASVQGADELKIPLPDLQAWEIATVALR